MSALDLILATESDKETGKQARAELAQLRATVADQARQLAEARNIIATVSLESFSTNGNSEYLRVRKYVRDICDAWLAANPAPEAEQA